MSELRETLKQEHTVTPGAEMWTSQGRHSEITWSQTRDESIVRVAARVSTEQAKKYRSIKQRPWSGVSQGQKLMSRS